MDETPAVDDDRSASDILRSMLPEALHYKLEPDEKFSPSLVELNGIVALLEAFTAHVGLTRIESNPMLYATWFIVRQYIDRLPKPTEAEIAEDKKLMEKEVAKMAGERGYTPKKKNQPDSYRPGMYL